MNTTNAKFLVLQTFDWIKAGVVTLGTAVLTKISIALTPILDKGTLPTAAQFKIIAIAALCGGLSYLLKNWLTNSQGVMFKKDPPADETKA